MISDLAFNLIGAAALPFYQSLTHDACQHIVEETELDCMFGFEDDLMHFLDYPSITKYVCFEKPSEELKSKAGEAQVYDFWARWRTQTSKKLSSRCLEQLLLRRRLLFSTRVARRELPRERK